MVAGFASACRQSPGANKIAVPTSLPEQLQQDLFDLVDQHLDQAFVWSRRTESYAVTLDSSEQRFDHAGQHWIVIGGLREGSEHSIAFLDTRGEALMSRARTFLASFGRRSGRSALEVPTLERLGVEHASELAHTPTSEFREPAVRLFEQSQKLGSSRIVFRASYLEAHSGEQFFLSRKQHQQVHSRRARGGILMAAWTGDDLASAQRQISGPGGPELVRLAADQIEACAQEALSHLHARSAATGMQEVLLSPEASAMLAYHGFAQGRRRLAGGPQLVTIVDRPRDGYGGFARDDLGQESLAQMLVGDTSQAPINPGHMRRDNRAVLRRLPSHVVVTPGTASLDTLIASIERGILLQAPVHCHLDPRTDRLSLICAQGREIHNGRFTGRLFARQLIRAGRQDFVDATTGLGLEPTTLAFDEAGVPVSASAPHWLSRAQVEAG